MADGFYYVGDIMFYILILLRIYVPFEVKKCTLYFLLSMIFIFCATAIFFYPNAFYPMLDLWIISIILTSTDFILNATILTIFILKMRGMISNLDPLVSMQAQKNINLMSNTVTKHSVLFGLAMILNQAFYLVVWYVEFHALFSRDWINGMYCVRAIENTVNVIVLWLVLRINYKKYICFCSVAETITDRLKARANAQHRSLRT